MRDEILKLVTEQKSGSFTRRIKSRYPDIFAEIQNINRFTTDKSRVYFWLFPEERCTCKKCGKDLEIYRISGGWHEYCSPKCRGKISTKSPTKTPQVNVTEVEYWPSKIEIQTLIDTRGGTNYLGKDLKKKYSSFYWYILSNGIGSSITEKIFNYMNPNVQRKCLHCENNVLFETWPNLGYKKFCSKKCSNVFNKATCVGGYNPTYFNYYPEEKNTQAYFYVLKLYDKNDFFYKVGITKRPIEDRLKEIAHYKKDVLLYKAMSLYEAFLKEQEKLKNFKEKQYKPLCDFSGKSECFKFEGDEWKVLLT